MNWSVPALTVVPPVYEFPEASTNVPAPILTNPPVICASTPPPMESYMVAVLPEVTVYVAEPARKRPEPIPWPF